MVPLEKIRLLRGYVCLSVCFNIVCLSFCLYVVLLSSELVELHRDG
jgi:hypothetical protein